MAKEFSIAVILEAVDKVTKTVDNIVHKTTHRLHELEERGEQMHEKLEKAFALPGGQLLAGAAEFLTIEKLTEAYEECTEAATDQAQVTAKLDVLMRNTKGGSDEAAKAAGEYAEQLEKQYSVNHKVTEAIEGQLATYRLTPELIKKATVPLLGYAESLHGVSMTSGDAVEATRQIGRALVSNTPSLTRLGIAFDKNQTKLWKHMTASERLAVITQRLDWRYKGLLSTMSKTPAGQKQALSNKMEGLEEKLGGPLLTLNYSLKKLALTAIPLLIPLIDKLAASLNTVVKVGTKYVDQVSHWIKAHPAAVAVLRNLALGAGAILAILGPLFKLITGVIKVIGWIGKFAGAIGSAIKWLIQVGPWIAETVTWFTTFGVSIETITALFPALGAAITLATGPVGIIIAAIAALVVVGVLVYKNWSKIKKFFMTLWVDVKKEFKVFENYLSKQFVGATIGLVSAWDKVKRWFASFKTWFLQLWQDVANSPAFKLLFGAQLKGADWIGKQAGAAWKWLTTDPTSAGGSGAPGLQPPVPQLPAPSAPRPTAMPGGSLPLPVLPGMLRVGGGHSTVHVQFDGAPRGTRLKTALAHGHTVGMGFTNASLLDN